MRNQVSIGVDALCYGQSGSLVGWIVGWVDGWFIYWLVGLLDGGLVRLMVG